jgi:hypothetical protein
MNDTKKFNEQELREILQKTAAEFQMDPKERALIELINGRPPRDEHERKMLEEIEQMRKDGIAIDIPFNL